MTVVLDYGMGNLRSVERAVQHLGYTCSIQSDLAGVTKLIIPGVGAFGAAMERLAPLRDDIRRLADDGMPIMGICLGQQLLFETSEELGSHEGLGILGGTVRYLPREAGLKVPHMGWTSLQPTKPNRLLDITPGGQVYFVHSLYTDCADAKDVAAVSEYGLPFPAAVERGNVCGTQFHPEKSGTVGLGILRSFLAC